MQAISVKLGVQAGVQSGLQRLNRRDPGFGPALRRDDTHRHRIESGRLVSSVELNHVSLIVYQVPASRVLIDLPPGTMLTTSISDGEEMAWVSVVSCIDRGLGGVESTTYRLHVTDGDLAAHVILGVSVGSLSSVGARNLWQMPWHLGAMELQAAYDTRQGCYTGYRLQTQSQWESACWEINDSGKMLTSETVDKLGIPVTVLSDQVRLLYSRPDHPEGYLSGMDIVYGGWAMTSGELSTARSEFLERSGLLKREELKRPVLVGLQPRGSLLLATAPIDRFSRTGRTVARVRGSALTGLQ